MSINKLLGLVLAVAVLLAPAFTRAGEAFAAVPGHHMQMMEAGHCQPPGKSGDRDQPATDDCCVSTCMAVAIVPPAPATGGEVRNALPASAVRAFALGVPAEIATPPPRSA